jgi:hypothetical protein
MVVIKSTQGVYSSVIALFPKQSASENKKTNEQGNLNKTNIEGFHQGYH